VISPPSTVKDSTRSADDLPTRALSGKYGAYASPAPGFDRYWSIRSAGRSKSQVTPAAVEADRSSTISAWSVTSPDYSLAA
jgi:hypothetical protein